LQILAREHWPALIDELGPERVCSLHARHVIATGHGRIWVDRWPGPSATAAFTGGNMGLSGDPAAVSGSALAAVVDDVLVDWERVFIDPGTSFARAVRGAIRGLRSWPRILYALPGPARPASAAPDADVRVLGAEDATALGDLDPSLDWIGDTHDGLEALAESGHAVGAFVGGRLVSVAAVFYVGSTYEEIGVVTEPAQQGRGLSTLCSAALVEQIRGRGRSACWSTTPDNRASQRVAEKLGFEFVSEQHHYLAGEPVAGSLLLDSGPGAAVSSRR